MKSWFGPIFAVALGAASPALCDLRELSPADLRDAVQNDHAISSRLLLQKVEQDTGGVVINMRAFTLNGTITYSLLIRHDSGTLDTVVIDGHNGGIIPPDTQIAARVAAFAQASQ